MLRTLKAILAMLVIVFVTAGCNSSMPVENNFRKLAVGVNTSDEVLNMFANEKVLQTTDRISLFSKKGNFQREVAIATIDPASSLLSRYVYMSRSRDMVNVKLRIIVEAKIPQDVLLKAYESESAKNVEIMRFCQESLRKDAIAFKNDQESAGLFDLASRVLATGISKLVVSPRDVVDANTAEGFTYDDTTAGECKLRLEHGENGDIYTISVHSKSAFDWLVKW